MRNIRWRDGTVLLQTMIICLLLAYVSISVTKWVLQRYTGVINTYRGNMAMGTAGGGVDRVISGWAFGSPSGSRLTVDSDKGMPYSYSVVTSGVYKVTFNYDTEQPQ